MPADFLRNVFVLKKKKLNLFIYLRLLKNMGGRGLKGAVLPRRGMM